MDFLAPELVDMFHSRGIATQGSDAAIAEQWARRIHFAFYSAKSSRGSNKFLALELTLTQVFARLSAGASAQFFWEFVVHVLLVLTQEPTLDAHTASPQPPYTARKSSKKRQPNAPLAFLVVKALKKLAAEGTSTGQAELCRLQGRRNEELRSFCLGGLGNSAVIDQKLLVELLGLFQITDIDPGLVRNALDQLIASKSHAALIKLCETLVDVDWPFETIVKRMVQTKDWTSAELLVRTFEVVNDTVLAKNLIEETIDQREFKRAHRFVANFNLQKQYPDVDVLYSRDGLMRLVETQRWQLAINFIGHDTTLQKVLLEHLVAAGELAHAAQLVKKMIAAGSKPDISLMNQTDLASCEIKETLGSSKHAVKDGGYLALPLEDQKIIFCDSEDAVRGALEHFFGSKSNQSTLEADECVDSIAGTEQVVGLDVEWKPIRSRSKRMTAVASILQVASSDRVFIIDLLRLHDNDFLFDKLLLRLLTSSQWIKLGFSFDSDLKVLLQTFPERQAFTSVSPFLDLNKLVLKCGTPVGTSLSQCVRHVLSKPLDKRMQLSDWEQRPLSQDQLNYAALDALCLVQIVKKLQSGRDNNGVTCWREASKLIGSADHAASLSQTEVVEAISQRIEYQKKWLLRCALENDTQCVKSLVTPQDIARIWKKREASQVHDLDVNFDTSLKFLPMDEIKGQLEDPQDGAETQNFIAVNSICIFVDDTPSVVCIDASCKLDVAQFARFYGVGRRRVRLATAGECRGVFGFTPGTVAPFGHKAWVPESGEESVQPEQIKVYADSRLRNVQYLAAGSGSQDEVIWVESKAFFALMVITLVGDVSAPRDTSRSLAPSHTDYVDVATGRIPEKDPQVLEHKFLTDAMVTQVGRWLRTIGVDVVAWNPDDAKVARSKDPKSVMLAFAAREDRIVLTRDTGLPSRRDAGACFVLTDDECYKQFREVKVQFGLLEQLDSRSSRCARCNSDVFSPIAAASARTKMSERLRKKVPVSVTKFWTCNGCSRIYWEGPKYAPATSPGAEPSKAGRVAYRPVPRKRIASDCHDQRHLPDLLP